MDEQKLLAERFEANRPHLTAVAYRMLGSRNEADDAVQEAWLRLSRADSGGVENLSGWLTTVTARVCLDMLRARKSHPEEPIDADAAELPDEEAAEPDQERILADSVGLALLVVLETLTPAERVAFVLHDMFDLLFEEIAPIVGRSPVAARQLASRARRKVRGAQSDCQPNLAGQRKIVEAFLSASRNGDFEGLLAVLDPDVLFRTDQAGVRAGSPPEIRGAQEVAATFKGRAQTARLAIVDGQFGLAIPRGAELFLALRFTFRGNRIAGIEATLNRDQLDKLDVAMMED